jgi:fructokinase
MVMKRVFCIGETVFDIIFKDEKPLSAKAGGAMLNTSVSLGRLGLHVSFISEIGEDIVGSSIVDFLIENSVDTSFIDRFAEGKTAIALAFLDKYENASYTFYKLYPKERLNIILPLPGEGDILLYGSFLSISADVRNRLIKFIKSAVERKAIILYDPNFRKPHLKDLPVVKDMILENIALSDIVRGSDEDFELIFGCRNADEAYEEVKSQGCELLIYTRGNKSVEFRSNHTAFSMEVPQIKPVSTIGAGDSFNAGLIYYLFNSGVTADILTSLDEASWLKAIRVAISFGSHVCLSMDNYISKDFASGF